MSTQVITVEQALATIDNALATINTNREGHVLLQQCVAVLRAAIPQAIPETMSEALRLQQE